MDVSRMMKRKTMVSVLFMEFSIIFTVCLIASNILETKQMVFGPLHLTGGLLIFPINLPFLQGKKLKTAINLFIGDRLKIKM